MLPWEEATVAGAVRTRCATVPSAWWDVLLHSEEESGKREGGSENLLLFQQQDLLILENIAFYNDLPYPVNATWIRTWKIYDGFVDQYKPAQKHAIYAVTKNGREDKVRYFNCRASNNKYTLEMKSKFATRWSSCLRVQEEITKYVTTYK